MLVFPRRCGRVAMGVVFVECDVGPGGHLAGRHQLLLDVPAGDTRSETFSACTQFVYLHYFSEFTVHYSVLFNILYL